MTSCRINHEIRTYTLQPFFVYAFGIVYTYHDWPNDGRTKLRDDFFNCRQHKIFILIHRALPDEGNQSVFHSII